MACFGVAVWGVPPISGGCFPELGTTIKKKEINK
jgi:hypothetical protein